MIRPLPVNTWKAHNTRIETIPSHFCATSQTSLTENSLELWFSGTYFLVIPVALSNAPVPTRLQPPQR